MLNLILLMFLIVKVRLVILRRLHCEKDGQNQTARTVVEE